jgi:hypothetical protein
MEEYLSTGRFPPSPSEAVTIGNGAEGFVETEVRTKYWWEFIQIYSILGVAVLFVNILSKFWVRLSLALSQ